MDDKFNEQKDILVAIKKEINLLHQQVDYLIRNEKPLELLDLDVMMNRTHTIYDLMCSVNLGSEELGVGSEEDELPVGLDEIKGLFGIEEKQEEELDDLDEQEEEQEGLELDQEETEGENENAYFIEEVEDVAEMESTGISDKETTKTTDEKPIETTEEGTTETTEERTIETADEDMMETLEGAIGSADETTETAEEMLETKDEMTETKDETTETKDEGILEDRGFILNFEPVEDPVEKTSEETDKDTTEKTGKEKDETSVYTTGDEIEMSIPLLDFGEEVGEDRETRDETREEDREKTEVEEEIAYEPVVIGDMEEKEDGGFELETPETLGERLQQGQDPTLADKLQRSALNSLQSAIGINDKFLFVNELFNGSMEKYNRSIANLDDLKTLNGALIYLNELRIELQWNSSNEAYKKLLELVHRKFGA